jgi:hypothetical protein
MRGVAWVLLMVGILLVLPGCAFIWPGDKLESLSNRLRHKWLNEKAEKRSKKFLKTLENSHYARGYSDACMDRGLQSYSEDYKRGYQDGQTARKSVSF